MLTLVITSIMLGAVYSVFLGTLSSKKYCDEVKDAGHCGQAILLLVQRDLQGAVPLGDGAVSLEGVDASEGGTEADRLAFVSTADTRLGNEKFDTNEVGYFAAASEAGEDEGEEETFLRFYRREDAGVDENPFTGGTEELLERRLVSFDLEYLDAQGGWTAEWTGEGLPAAVRVTLVINRRVGEDRESTRNYTYSTLVPLWGGK
jgi:hypothetical protein